MALRTISPDDIAWAKVSGWPWWPAVIMPVKTVEDNDPTTRQVVFLVDNTAALVKTGTILPFSRDNLTRLLAPSSLQDKRLMQAVDEARALQMEGLVNRHSNSAAAAAGEPPTGALLPGVLPSREDVQKRSGRQLSKWLRQAALDPQALYNKILDQSTRRVLGAIQHNARAGPDAGPSIRLPAPEPAKAPAKAPAAAALTTGLRPVVGAAAARRKQQAAQQARMAEELFHQQRQRRQQQQLLQQQAAAAAAAAAPEQRASKRQRRLQRDPSGSAAGGLLSPSLPLGSAAAAAPGLPQPMLKDWPAASAAPRPPNGSSRSLVAQFAAAAVGAAFAPRDAAAAGGGNPGPSAAAAGGPCGLARRAPSPRTDASCASRLPPRRPHQRAGAQGGGGGLLQWQAGAGRKRAAVLEGEETDSDDEWDPSPPSPVPGDPGHYSFQLPPALQQHAGWGALRGPAAGGGGEEGGAYGGRAHQRQHAAAGGHYVIARVGSSGPRGRPRALSLPGGGAGEPPGGGEAAWATRIPRHSTGSHGLFGAAHAAPFDAAAAAAGPAPGSPCCFGLGSPAAGGFHGGSAAASPMLLDHTPTGVPRRRIGVGSHFAPLGAFSPHAVAGPRACGADGSGEDSDSGGAAADDLAQVHGRDQQFDRQFDRQQHPDGDGDGDGDAPMWGGCDALLVDTSVAALARARRAGSADCVDPGAAAAVAEEIAGISAPAAPTGPDRPLSPGLGMREVAALLGDDGGGGAHGGGWAAAAGALSADDGLGDVGEAPPVPRAGSGSSFCSPPGDEGAAAAAATAAAACSDSDSPSCSVAALDAGLGAGCWGDLEVERAAPGQELLADLRAATAAAAAAVGAAAAGGAGGSSSAAAAAALRERVRDGGSAAPPPSPPPRLVALRSLLPAGSGGAPPPLPSPAEASARERLAAALAELDAVRADAALQRRLAAERDAAVQRVLIELVEVRRQVHALQLLQHHQQVAAAAAAAATSQREQHAACGGRGATAAAAAAAAPPPPGAATPPTPPAGAPTAAAGSLDSSGAEACGSEAGPQQPSPPAAPPAAPAACRAGGQPDPQQQQPDQQALLANLSCAAAAVAERDLEAAALRAANRALHRQVAEARASGIGVASAVLKALLASPRLSDGEKRRVGAELSALLVRAQSAASAAAVAAAPAPAAAPAAL